MNIIRRIRERRLKSALQDARHSVLILARDALTPLGKRETTVHALIEAADQLLGWVYDATSAKDVAARLHALGIAVGAGACTPSAVLDSARTIYSFLHRSA